MKKYLFTFFVSLSFSSASFAVSYLQCSIHGYENTPFVPNAITQPYIDIGLISGDSNNTVLKGTWHFDGSFVIDHTFASRNDAISFCTGLKEQCKKASRVADGAFVVYTFDRTGFVYVLSPDQPQINCDTLLIDSPVIQPMVE